MKSKSNTILIISIVTGILLAVLVGILVFFNLPAQRIRRMLKTANKYIAEENYDEAILTLQRMLEIDPKNPVIYSNLAEVYFHKADNSSSEEEKLSLYESANENYLNALNYSEDEDSELNDSLNELYLNWSQVYIEREDYITAQEVLKQGIDISEQEVLKDKLEEVAKQTSGSDMFNENARAVNISILQVYQPKSYDRVYPTSEGVKSSHCNCSYTYDESGKLPVSINIDGNSTGKITYRYDANMLPIYVEGHLGEDDWVGNYFYNDNGQLIQSDYYDFSISIDPADPYINNSSYEYDVNGKCLNETSKRSFKFEHDNKGRISAKIHENDRGTVTYKYEYDELNRIIKRKRIQDYENAKYTSVTTYNY